MTFSTITTQNTSHISNQANRVATAHASTVSLNKVANIAEKNAKKRWLCNVSEGVKLSKSVKYGLNIDSRGKLTQYELMVKLLKTETCDVIYFDCHLSASQIGILKMLQVFSNTELVHARLAMQFERAMG